MANNAQKLSTKYYLLGVQPCFRRFSLKFKALFLKSDYVLMIQSIVRR